MMDFEDSEPTQRVLADLRPTPSEIPDAIARLRYQGHTERRERRSLKKWAAGVIVSVIAASITVAVSVGRYVERVDAVTPRLERLEQLLIEDRRSR